MKITPLEITYLTGLAVMALTLLASAAGLTPTLFLVNESSSMPRGLYLRALGHRPTLGDVVAARPGPAAKVYLKSLGAPDDARLLKRVAALAGDVVCADGDEVRLPSRAVTALRRDRRGRPLPRWTGCLVLASGQAFLLGDSETSFDGRYFGPAALADIDGVFWRVLTW